MRGFHLRSWISAPLLAGALACATVRPPVSSPQAAAVPTPPEVEASTAFLHGRQLELEGRFPEAAESYERAVRIDPDSPVLRRFLAGAWLRSGDLRRALEHTQIAHGLAPEDERIRAELASLYMGLERYPEAVALLEPSYRSGELAAEGMVVLFDLYLRLGRTDEAEQLARAMLARSPERVQGYLMLGAVLERSKRIDEAEKVYLDALDVDPTQGVLWEGIARIARERDDAERELTALLRKLELEPADPMVMMRVSHLYEQRNEPESAVQVLEELVGMFPGFLGAHFRLGYLYYGMGRLADAALVFEAVLQAGPALDERYANEVRYFLGVILGDAKQPQKALDVLAHVPVESDRYAEARVLAARIQEATGAREEAIENVRRAIAAAPGNDALRVYLAGMLQRSGRTDEAIGLVEALLRANPKDADRHYDLGVLFGEAGQEERALETMAHVLELAPDHSGALNYIGYSWADRGQRLDEAERMIRRAIELSPGDGFITDSLGWVHYQRGRQLLAQGQDEAARRSFLEAVEQLERALELLERDDPIITWHLGDVYRSLARLEDALAAYRRALDLEPSEEDAQRIRERILQVEREIESVHPDAGKGDGR
jgi:tetratricopeptide (TPR) repeat protein